MQLDAGIEPTLRFAYMTCINLNIVWKGPTNLVGLNQVFVVKYVPFSRGANLNKNSRF